MIKYYCDICKKKELKNNPMVIESADNWGQVKMYEIKVSYAFHGNTNKKSDITICPDCLISIIKNRNFTDKYFD